MGMSLGLVFFFLFLFFSFLFFFSSFFWGGLAGMSLCVLFGHVFCNALLVGISLGMLLGMCGGRKFRHYFCGVFLVMLLGMSWNVEVAFGLVASITF